MTQEFVTLPREVVEQALEALFEADSVREDYQNVKVRRDSIAALRAVLDQPQANQPAMTPIARRKLEDLMASGYTISGYSIYHEQKHQHGFVTGAGLVGWWKPEGVEYPQQKGEQKPVAWQGRDGYLYHFIEEPKPGDRPLYTYQKPKREPLTEMEIVNLRQLVPGTLDVQFVKFARTIEAAHNIK